MALRQAIGVEWRLMLALPDYFTRRIAALYGAEGQAWLVNLPALIARCARMWSLSLEPPYEPRYNLVIPARTASGAPVVLKLGVPGPEGRREIEALRIYDGRGCARLLAAAPEDGAMLLERLAPGTMLVALDDEAATRIAAGVMHKLWRPLPPAHAFPSTTAWASGLQQLRPTFGGGCGPFPPRLVEAAERLFTELLATRGEPVLLHGDLQHYNILAAEREPWLAIDPQGVAGEPLYETGAWMRNPIPQVAAWTDLKQALALRAAVFAEMLQADRRRILAWATAQAVLSSWWSFEEEGKPAEGTLHVAATALELYESS